MMKFIRVTPEHVTKGVRNSPSRCPLALALKDIYKGVQDIRVTGNKILFLTADGEQLESTLSVDMQRMVKHFDDTGEMPTGYMVGWDLPIDFDIPELYERKEEEKP